MGHVLAMISGDSLTFSYLCFQMKILVRHYQSEKKELLGSEEKRCVFSYNIFHYIKQVSAIKVKWI